jgi:hypothetical protein
MIKRADLAFTALKFVCSIKLANFHNQNLSTHLIRIARLRGLSRVPTMQPPESGHYGDPQTMLSKAATVQPLIQGID